MSEVKDSFVSQDTKMALTIFQTQGVLTSLTPLSKYLFSDIGKRLNQSIHSSNCQSQNP
jgi:hypothetical protein